MENENFTVQCNVCGQQFDNWVGSTPCCGSIAYLLDSDGKKTKEFVLYGSLNGEEIKPVHIKPTQP